MTKLLEQRIRSRCASLSTDRQDFAGELLLTFSSRKYFDDLKPASTRRTTVNSPRRPNCPRPGKNQADKVSVTISRALTGAGSPSLLPIWCAEHFQFPAGLGPIALLRLMRVL